MGKRHNILDAILQELRPKNVPPAQKEALNTFKLEVREFLQKEFPLHVATVGSPFEMGSTKKGTDIALKYDLDLFLPFQYGYAKGPKGIRTAVLHAIQRHCQGTRVAVRDQRVSVGLTKMFGTGAIAVDVVPGMEMGLDRYNEKTEEDPKWNEDAKYLILYDRVQDKSITTNVHRQVRLIKEEAERYRDTVRLLKAWRYQQPDEHPVGSYALELMVYEAVRSEGAPATGSHDKLLSFVLRHCVEHLQKDWVLRDIGANNTWKDFLKVGAKLQLAGLWWKLALLVESGTEEKIRKAFLG